MKYEIIEKRTVKECLRYCLEKGIIPLSIKEIRLAIRTHKIEKAWYNSREVLLDEEGTISVLELDLKLIEDILEGKIKGRLLFLSDISNGLIGIDNLSSDGRFVGVRKREEQEE